MPGEHSFPHPAYARHVLSPNFEQTKTYLVRPMLAASRAHTVMLVRQGILGRETGRRLLSGLTELEVEGVSGVTYTGEFEDLFFYLEHRLGELAGTEAVGNLQIARSRNDLDGTLCRWVTREKLLALLAGIVTLRRRVLALAEAHIESLMPGYTHTQPAQPMTLAHYLAAVAAFLERDAARLQAAYGRVNLCPLGAVAFTTTGFPIDRDLVARLLGFAGPVPGAYDAVGGADYQVEVAGVVQVAAASLSRFVTDLLFWATQDSGTLRIGDEFIQISSIMPQKRNPVVLEHVRTQLGYVYGDTQAVFMLQHNAPLGDVNDVEDPIYRLLFRLLEYASGVYELLDAVLASASWRVKRMAARAAAGFTTATELADVLVREAHLPFRSAHRVVAQLVGSALAAGLGPGDMTSGHLDAAAQAVLGYPLGLPDALVAEALDPRHFVEIRKVLGGPAPAAVRSLLTGHAKRLKEDEGWHAEQLARLAQAHEQLNREVSKLLS